MIISRNAIRLIQPPLILFSHEDFHSNLFRYRGNDLNDEELYGAEEYNEEYNEEDYADARDGDGASFSEEESGEYSDEESENFLPPVT